MSLFFLLTMFAAAAMADDCTYPWCFHLRINNCLEPLTLIDCGGAVGKWVQRPGPVINSYNWSWIEIYPVSLSNPTIGNCTFHYTNKHGRWTAFVDWDFATLGERSRFRP